MLVYFFSSSHEAIVVVEYTYLSNQLDPIKVNYPFIDKEQKVHQVCMNGRKSLSSLNDSQSRHLVINCNFVLKNRLYFTLILERVINGDLV